MAGNGNLLLKRKLGSDAIETVAGLRPGIPTNGNLSETMPAFQFVGLPPVDRTTGMVTAGLNVPNRLWIGTNRLAKDATTPWEGGATPSITVPTNNANRPLWIGAEIRAFAPVHKNSTYTFTGTTPPASPPAVDDVYTVLKADWASPSDYVLVTQKAIWGYINGLLGLTSIPADGSVAVLTGDKPGTQTFQLPIAIEQKLSVNGYTYNNINYPATISCDNVTAASIFDTTVTDISMGGAAEFVEIGDSSTGGNTATTIYGELTITGPTNLSTDTVIDGGIF